MAQSAHWLKNALAGFLIGIGCVLPGVSGGVMSVSFGLYRPMLEAVLDFFHDPKRHFRFLFPIAVGGALGVLVTAWGLTAVISRYERLTLFLFIGFLLGGVPDLWKECLEGEERHWNNDEATHVVKKGLGRVASPTRRLLWLGLGAVLALPLLLCPQGVSISRLNPVQAVAIGLLEGIGTIVPGVSTSFILIRLGWYTAYLNALSGIAIGLLLPTALGFTVSALVCMKTVQWLFDRYTSCMYAVVLGFLLLSAAMVFPGFDRGLMCAADLALVVIGVVCARWLSKL